LLTGVDPQAWLADVLARIADHNRYPDISGPTMQAP
jgi:IS66 C-terminal element